MIPPQSGGAPGKIDVIGIWVDEVKFSGFRDLAECVRVA